ncbi:MAG: hypothetical protein QF773_00435 [Lentisphaeria bacterium]|jgi:glyoxylase-like metal-dependent hydrolase (beta-lactamase superfamily II)|nr:hypothetical protein [Lentisphaeria bacterium]
MLQPITSQLYRFEDTCNVYVLTDGDRALLIDCGGGAVRSAISLRRVRLPVVALEIKVIRNAERPWHGRTTGTDPGTRPDRPRLM